VFDKQQHPKPNLKRKFAAILTMSDSNNLSDIDLIMSDDEETEQHLKRPKVTEVFTSTSSVLSPVKEPTKRVSFTDIPQVRSSTVVSSGGSVDVSDSLENSDTSDINTLLSDSFRGEIEVELRIALNKLKNIVRSQHTCQVQVAALQKHLDSGTFPHWCTLTLGLAHKGESPLRTKMNLILTHTRVQLIKSMLDNKQEFVNVYQKEIDTLLITVATKVRSMINGVTPTIDSHTIFKLTNDFLVLLNDQHSLWQQHYKATQLLRQQQLESTAIELRAKRARDKETRAADKLEKQQAPTPAPPPPPSSTATGSTPGTKEVEPMFAMFQKFMALQHEASSSLVAVETRIDPKSDTRVGSTRVDSTRAKRGGSTHTSRRNNTRATRVDTTRDTRVDTTRVGATRDTHVASSSATRDTTPTRVTRDDRDQTPRNGNTRQRDGRRNNTRTNGRDNRNGGGKGRRDQGQGRGHGRDRGQREKKP